MKKLRNILTLAAASLFALVGVAIALSPIISSFTPLNITLLTAPGFTFANGTVANATQVNANFTQVQTQVNTALSQIQTQTNAALTAIQTQVNAFQVGGSWTPADGSGAGLVFTGVSAGYTQIGNMVHAYATLTYPSNANGNQAIISGLPVTVANATYASQCFVSGPAGVLPANFRMGANPNATTINLYVGGGTATNTQLSTDQVTFECIYPAS